MQAGSFDCTDEQYRAIHAKAKNKIPATLWNRINGLAYVSMFWMLSWINYCFLLLPLSLICPTTRIYNQLAEWIQMPYFTFITAWLEFIHGMKVTISCPDRNLDFGANENLLIICNHRTELDWLFHWNLAMRFHKQHSLKVMLKASLRLVPGTGWALRLLDFPFVKRDWIKDQSPLTTQMHRYRREAASGVWLSMFPEGTTIDDATFKKSWKFSKENQLQKYFYVLQPRVKGFQLCVDEFKPDCIVDLTIGYRELQQGVRPSPGRLSRGQFPKAVDIHVQKYYSKSNWTTDDMEKWLRQRFDDKEKRLGEFYRKGEFSDPVIQFPSPTIYHFVASCIFNSFLTYALVYATIQYPLLQYWCTFATAYGFASAV